MSFQWFDRRYRQFVLAGLSACVWFSAFAYAAHDLWAATCVFAWLTALALALLVGHARTGRAIRLPLAGPVLLILAALAVSTRFSFDAATSRLETWTWCFSFLGFYLFANSAEGPSSIDAFFFVASYILVPLAAYCAYLRWSDRSPEVHANLINSIVMSGFALNWVFFLWDRRRTRGAYSLIALAACLLLLYLGRSWWAGVSLAIGFMYHYKENVKSLYLKKKDKFILYAILACVVLVSALSFKFRLYQKHGYPDSNRLAWWIAAIRMSAQHPWVGVGLGSYGTAYPFFRVGRGLNTLFAHDFPLQLLAETGLAGIFAIFWFARQFTQNMQGGNRVYKAAFITVLCFSLVHINMEYFLNKILLLFILVPFIKTSEKDLVLSPGRGMTVAALTLILSIPAWVIPWIASTHLVEGQRLEDSNDWSSARTEYQKAVDLDPASADAFAGLARISEEAYHGHGSSANFAQARAYWIKAFHQKKSVAYLSHLDHPEP